MSQIPYDRGTLRPRIAHVGFGAFARAHVMLYLHETLRQTGGDWGAVAIRLNSGAKALSALDAAKGCYTVAELEGDAVSARVIGAVIATSHPRRDGARAVIDRMARADIITLTITEKGYGLVEGRFDLARPEVQADLAQLDAPTTAIGYLVAALRQRRKAGLGGQTIMSCDNLPMNGTLCRHAVLSFAKAFDPALAVWIETRCAFPATMVDRIVPALDEAGRAVLRDLPGRDDINGIVTEPFRQWVIEDRFAADRPGWEQVGAQIVPDVAPFEDMKLRMLNGAHSFLAYAGALHGHATIADCMDDPAFASAARHLMLRDQAPTLRGFAEPELTDYADALLRRFANTALKHRTLQIATDGSQKLPQRLLQPIADNLAKGRLPRMAILAVAGWMQFCRGQAESGTALPLNDPMQQDLRTIAKQYDGAGYVAALLNLRAIFPAALAGDLRFHSALAQACEAISARGMRQAISAQLEGVS